MREKWAAWLRSRVKGIKGSGEAVWRSCDGCGVVGGCMLFGLMRFDCLVFAV
jgi:hypothetical protein